MREVKEATTHDFVRFYDPEIVAHNDAPTCGRYSIERDLSTLNIPPEAKPVIFHCRALSRDQRNAVSELTSDRRRYDLAFRYGVLEIHNLPDENGGYRPPLVNDRPKPHATVTNQWIDAAGLGDIDVAEIGSAIYGMSFLALGVPPRCVQLESSLVAFGAAERLSAERRTG